MSILDGVWWSLAEVRGACLLAVGSTEGEEGEKGTVARCRPWTARPGVSSMCSVTSVQSVGPVTVFPSPALAEAGRAQAGRARADGSLPRPLESRLSSAEDVEMELE